MKARRVIISIELETDMIVKDIKEILTDALDPFVVDANVLEIIQIQANVVKK